MEIKIKAVNNSINHNNLAIQKIDKVDNIVILNKSDYISKLSKILTLLVPIPDEEKKFT